MSPGKRLAYREFDRRAVGARNVNREQRELENPRRGDGAAGLQFVEKLEAALRDLVREHSGR